MAKAPAAPPPSNFDLSAEDRQAVKDHTAKIRVLKKQREGINSQINAERKSIKALGIDLDAWRAAERRWEMDPDEREQFDRSHEICSSALGVPLHAVQADLFEEDGDEQPSTPSTKSDGGDLPASVH